MERETKVWQGAIKSVSADGDQGIVEAIVSVFGNEDDGGDIVEPGFFSDDLKQQPPRWKAVFSHEWNLGSLLGKTLEARELLPGDPALPPQLQSLGGLYVKGALNLDTQAGRDAYSHLKFGSLDEFSFAYAATQTYRDSEGRRHLVKGKAFEWGPTVAGMNPATALLGVKAAAPHGPMGTADNPITHSHAHSAMGSQGGDATHEHSHTHAGDANHDHTHEKAAPRRAALAVVGRKKAIGRHKTETSDRSWDGPKVEASIPTDATAATLRGFYAWQDPDRDPATKAAYRFIHHFNDNGTAGAASTVACSTGIGVLNGGRGGTTIPDADKQGVYRHLAGHLTDAGMEPPELAKALHDLQRKYYGDYGYGSGPFPYALPGSYEALQEDLQEAASTMLTAWSIGPLEGLLDVDDGFDLLNACVLLVDTRPDAAIFFIQADPWDDPDDGLLVRCPYTVDADGEPQLGEPELMQPAFVPMRAAPPVELAGRFKRHASGLLLATRTLGRKEGRVLSGSNRQTLLDCRDALKAAMATLDDLLAATEPPEKAAGRAAFAAHLRESARRLGVAL